MERAAETPPHMPMQWPEPASPTSKAPTRSRLAVIGLGLDGFLGRFVFIKQYVGSLAVEIFKLLGANGPKEDGACDDDKQDGDGDQDEDDVHDASLAMRVVMVNQLPARIPLHSICVGALILA
jgi:hypothetical protein